MATLKSLSEVRPGERVYEFGSRGSMLTLSAINPRRDPANGRYWAHFWEGTSLQLRNPWRTLVYASDAAAGFDPAAGVAVLAAQGA